MEFNKDYKVAVFDCDGVILDSNNIKSAAFAYALKDEPPELIEQFISYHKKNGGISRYIKFDYFYKKIKKQINYQSNLDKSLSIYASYCRKELLTSNEVLGVRKFLIKLQQLNIPCYVISGGEQDEVRYILEKKSLTSYFDTILGSPVSKQDHLSALYQNNKLKSPSIYFGDAKSDYEAAIKFDMNFVFVSGVSEWNNGEKMCDVLGVASIIDFNGINYS